MDSQERAETEAELTNMALLRLRQAASSTAVGCLLPEPPLPAIITHLCLSQMLIGPFQPRGDGFVGGLLGHAVAAATAIANQTASAEPPAECCALCLNRVPAWQLQREPVVPSFLLGPAAVAAVARHSVFACGECLPLGREWEKTFRCMYEQGATDPVPSSGSAGSWDASQPVPKPGKQRQQEDARGFGGGGSKAVTTRNREAGADDAQDSDVGDGSDEDTPPTEEHVRNYVAFVCLKALMCPTIMRHPDRGESVLDAKLRPWATLTHHLRDQLIIERFVCRKASPVRAPVLVSLIPQDSFLAQHQSGGGEDEHQQPPPLPAWGFAPAAAAVVVPLGRLLVAVALPTSTLQQQREWAECPAGTSDLWRLLRDKKPWSPSQLSTWLRAKSRWPESRLPEAVLCVLE